MGSGPVESFRAPLDGYSQAARVVRSCYAPLWNSKGADQGRQVVKCLKGGGDVIDPPSASAA